MLWALRRFLFYVIASNVRMGVALLKFSLNLKEGLLLQLLLPLTRYCCSDDLARSPAVRGARLLW